jgi:hypothetical protein
MAGLSTPSFCCQRWRGSHWLTSLDVPPCGQSHLIPLSGGKNTVAGAVTGEMDFSA